jgi:histidine ammonia-lyase
MSADPLESQAFSKDRFELAQAVPIQIDGKSLTIEDVAAVAHGRKRAVLSCDERVIAKVELARQFLDRKLEQGEQVYGINTGYGDSCVVRIPEHLVADLPHQLVRYHGCGTGAFLDDASVLAVLVVRMNSLVHGHSGVRWALLEAFEQLLIHRILPRIPAEGSVGASGDLTPLSYVAATLMGERDVTYRGEVRSSEGVLRQLGLPTMKLARKEGLAIMNGTSVMTALACLAWSRAEYLSRLAARLTALTAICLRSHRNQFHPRLFAVKPHAGQSEIAAWIYRDLEAGDTPLPETSRLQDRYSIRCAPHVIGVLRDGLSWMRRDIQNELNSANDNPIVDADAGMILHGGHFYGGHIGFAMDALKLACASVADLLDRQIAILVDSKMNEGLPANISGASGDRAAINHGFKAVQISTSAWAAEALKLTMPATAFSRSTESHNQDKVSMGTIAARDCIRVLELTEQVAAASVLATYQALVLRERQGFNRRALTGEIARFVDEIGTGFAVVDEDRALDVSLVETTRKIQARAWPLYD